ncbi:MAG: diguanylate cyclase [Campylobacterota bacterium]|nr:diguanylate cyclase [Campylobacterota bacterium]
MQKSTILIVDDTETNIDILLELLSNKYDLLVAVDGTTAVETVLSEKIDLILLDIMMPYMDGFEVCESLKRLKETKDIPIIFLTAKTDEISIAKAYEVGGIDYISKPFKPIELLARIKTQLKVKKLIDNLKRSKDELKLLASTDSMTKLYNRRYFSKVSEHIFDLAKRDKVPLSVILLDIDKFKDINDTYGHNIGDEIIIKLANKLKEHQRKSDIVCRYGGEEFVLLLPNTSSEGAMTVANKIKEEVENTTTDISDDIKIKFTVSLGVSDIENRSENSIEAALIRADKALYKAKETGRNKVICNILNKDIN